MSVIGLAINASIFSSEEQMFQYNDAWWHLCKTRECIILLYLQPPPQGHQKTGVYRRFKATSFSETIIRFALRISYGQDGY